MSAYGYGYGYPAAAPVYAAPAYPAHRGIGGFAFVLVIFILLVIIGAAALGTAV
ncbi:uncharacterized protein (TIGR01732 family) [Evansella vedderi]|uniref:Uncharacterized protein (TIGR01732 family) n=1 Tax=Evansella vedderi TaxID=38282 RepID=A0ABT9ZYC7_9BACI|nr:YjcZ family sporulation protein [Evansella vedderi]MDQ0255701.1 uncharacterized protein (TIGR01732 family) [Evansella vedderi]